MASNGESILMWWHHNVGPNDGNDDILPSQNRIGGCDISSVFLYARFILKGRWCLKYEKEAQMVKTIVNLWQSKHYV